LNLQDIIPKLDHDGKLVILSSAIRTLDYGFLTVFLGVYLTLMNFTVTQAGLIFAGIMAGSALSNAIASWKGDFIGRKNFLLILAGLMAFAGFCFPLASNVYFLILIGLFAVTTSSGGDRTAFTSIDTAILAQTCRPNQRTLVFSYYNLTTILTKAIGALLITIPHFIQSTSDISEINSFKLMFLIYAFFALLSMLSYSGLSRNIEPDVTPKKRHSASRSKDEKALIIKMTALSSMDALGGGFVLRSFISFWFVNQFGVSLFSLSAIFFSAQLLNLTSVALASPLATRIGLVNTMVFTQVAANLTFVGMAFSNGLSVAIGFFLLHELCNDMDVPTRQSYTMAIVPAESRTAMASLNNLGRNIAQVISPISAGLIAQVTFLGAPFIAGAIVKLGYNYALYTMFREIKPEG